MHRVLTLWLCLHTGQQLLWSDWRLLSDLKAHYWRVLEKNSKLLHFPVYCLHFRICAPVLKSDHKGNLKRQDLRQWPQSEFVFKFGASYLFDNTRFASLHRIDSIFEVQRRVSLKLVELYRPPQLHRLPHFLRTKIKHCPIDWEQRWQVFTYQLYVWRKYIDRRDIWDWLAWSFYSCCNANCEYHLDRIHYFEVILILESFSFNWSFHRNLCSHSGFKPNVLVFLYNLDHYIRIMLHGCGNKTWRRYSTRWQLLRLAHKDLNNSWISHSLSQKLDCWARRPLGQLLD